MAFLKQYNQRLEHEVAQKTSHIQEIQDKMVLGIADIFVAIRFIKHSKIRFKNISDMDAAKAYCKIHGFDSKIEEKK